MRKEVILMCTVVLSGCLSEPTLTSLEAKVPGKVISELPSSRVGLKLGQTEQEVEVILAKAGYTEKPNVTTITSDEKTESDCGRGSPILLKNYSRSSRYNEQDVEFNIQVYFKDNDKNDQKCIYHSAVINPIKVREPSYMKELINAKNK